MIQTHHEPQGENKRFLSSLGRSIWDPSRHETTAAHIVKSGKHSNKTITREYSLPSKPKEILLLWSNTYLR